MGPLEDMALKKDMGVLIQLSQVRRALGALLGKVEGAAKRESVHPSIQLDSSPKAALAQNVGRLFLGGLPVLWEGGATVSCVSSGEF